MFKTFNNLKNKANASAWKVKKSAKMSLESLKKIPVIGASLYWILCTLFFGLLGAICIVVFPVLFVVGMVVGFWMVCAMAMSVLALPYLLILGWGEYGIAMNLLYILIDIFAIGVSSAILNSRY